MKLVFMALMGLFLAKDLFSQEQPVTPTEEQSSRRREGAPSSGSEGESADFRDSQLFEEIRDCESSDCPCCVYLGRITVNRGEPDERVIDHATVCKTDNSQMENVATEWGHLDLITVNGQEFRIYNADASQIAVIREVLEVLPSPYLVAAPRNIRIGNTSNGSIHTSSEGTMVNVPGRSKPVHVGVPGGETIGGGSRRCRTINDDYDYIILHPLVFVPHPKENPRRTILHEVGHFVEREYGVVRGVIRRHSSQFEAYLDRYNGDSRGNDEVIASGFCYYFLRKFWESGTTLRATPLTRVPSTGEAGIFPEWLRDIIQADVDSRS